MPLFTPGAATLDCYMGSTIRWQFQWELSGTPIDFTGQISSWRAKMRRTYDDATPLFEVDSTGSFPSYIETDSVNGKITVWVDHAVTSAFTYETVRPSTVRSAVFDLEAVIDSGTVLSGNVATALGLSGAAPGGMVFELVRSAGVTVYPEATY
jgi:hypothetical protein